MKKITNEELLNAIVNMRIKTERGSPYWCDVIQRAIQHHNDDAELYSQIYKREGEFDDYIMWNDWTIAYTFSRDLKRFYERTWGMDCTANPIKPPVKQCKEGLKRLKEEEKEWEERVRGRT